MNSPFKFLDSYTKEDAAIFFGRDRETEELYQKVFESKVILLYGVSGTGKSSLIDCGLGNKIDDSDWLPLSIRRGSGIIESLWQKLSELDLTVSPSPHHPVSPSNISPEQIVKKIQSVYLDHFKPIYLIFDQFEELFIFGSREEREEFITIARAIMDADIQCKMLFSIREEYLANITEFERKVPEIMQNRMRVEKMSRSKAIEVICGPCSVNGIELEEGFEEALMNKLVPEGNEVELTYLQVYLDKIFKEATGTTHYAKSTTQNESSSPDSKTLTFPLSILDQLGTVGDLLGSFLEDQVKLLENPESGLAILKSFVSVKGTKRQITHEEVFESCKTLGTEVKDEPLKELINKFVDLRILRDKNENGRYELRHDSLAAKIFEKITLVEKEIMEVRMFIENAFAAYQARKTLLSDDDLKYIEPYEDRLFLVKELQDFVAKSKHDFEAKKRSFKRIISISIIGFTLLIAAGAYYFYQQSQDRDVTDLTLMSMMQTDFSQNLSLKSAMRAYHEDSTKTITKLVLLEAFYKKLDTEPEIKKNLFDFIPVHNPILFIDLSADGQYIYGYLENNEVHIWDLDGKEIMYFTIPGEPIRILRMSDNNDYMGAYLQDSTIAVYSIRDSSIFSVNTTPNGVNDKYLFDFSNREEYVIAVLENELVKLYDKNGEVFQILNMHDSTVNAIDISPDKRFLATASADANINIWYFNTKLQQYSIYNTIEKKSKTNVRSCQFNQLSNYILSSSDDSASVIHNLNGEFIVSLENYSNEDIWGNNNALLGRECDAYFVHGEQTIVVRRREDQDDPESLLKRTNLYVSHYRTSDFFTASGDVYNDAIIDVAVELWSVNSNRYDFLVPAPDTRTIATVRENGNKVNVVGSENIPILVFDGTNPLYTHDSKYIISIHGNVLEKHVVDPDEIFSLIAHKKIFGELEYDVRDWLSY
ncbi:hypothetical protein ACFLRQ_01565 [Bacteroidota bacterium]